ncbi:Fic family protein [Bengtsoniella intestinalis]|uniref:type II toxin-antitoxin system death-on-curing family toxin n=1 Tax=Bengtsoniella intestinalis TaxID=3073143 RepID=UPI00391F45E1
MGDIIYLSIDQAKATHLRTIHHSGGGTTEIIDIDRLESVLIHMENDDYYPSFEDKITHLFFSVCQFHCFADGNKRLAITLSLQFLLLNGYLAVAQTFMGDTEMVSLNVAAGKIDKSLLFEIMVALLDGTYSSDEALKLKIYNAIKD